MWRKESLVRWRHNRDGARGCRRELVAVQGWWRRKGFAVSFGRGLGVLMGASVGFGFGYLDSQPSTKGNGGFYDGFCLCGGIGRVDCFGGGFRGDGFGGGTDLVPFIFYECLHHFLSSKGLVMVIDSVMLSGTTATTVAAACGSPHSGGWKSIGWEDRSSNH
uniref:Uncharacterized protein n=1 Tax=Fagus sylvatica TaxID=28930 RepID=A0A2N9JAH0_FAGSY